MGGVAVMAVEDGVVTADVVSVQHLSKIYSVDSQKAVVALDEVDLDVARGEFVSLVGPSGCGKSTLLNIIAGLIPASSGEVRFRGQVVTGPQRDIGMMFQQPVLLPWRTNIDNVLLPLEVRGKIRDQDRQRAQQLLAGVGLGEFGQAHPQQLSGGMQQRVAICRMLITEPSLLLMDEPFGALDEMTREHMNLELLKVVQRVGSTVIFVTHSIQEAVFLSDRVVVMSARPGKIKEVVPIDLERPRGLELLRDDAFYRYIRLIREALEQ